jgi:dienelactone hydrolase
VFIPFVAAMLAQGFELQGERFTWKDAERTFEGVYLKPAGDGPFPAVLISHGLGGNAQGFGLPKAREMVKWGLVCIAPTYTHAGQGGDRATFGAGAENLKRAAICLDILAKQPYVDAKRLAAYGNSMGAFVTVGLAAVDPRLRAAAITAGGVAPKDGMPAPSEAAAAKIRTPFYTLHGMSDTTVRPEQSAKLNEILDAAKVPHGRATYEGVGHQLHQEKASDVYAKIKDWFRRRGVLADP